MSEYQCFNNFTTFYNQFYESTNSDRFASSLRECIDICKNTQTCNGINYNYNNICVILKDESFNPNLINYNIDSGENSVFFYMRSFNNCYNDPVISYPYFLTIILSIILAMPFIYFVCCYTSRRRRIVSLRVPYMNDNSIPPPYQEVETIENGNHQENQHQENQHQEIDRDTNLAEEYTLTDVEVNQDTAPSYEQSPPIPIPQRRNDFM